jgi:hypothetical protein
LRKFFINPSIAIQMGWVRQSCKEDGFKSQEEKDKGEWGDGRGYTMLIADGKSRLLRVAGKGSCREHQQSRTFQVVNPTRHRLIDQSSEINLIDPCSAPRTHFHRNLTPRSPWHRSDFCQYQVD